MPGSNLVPVDQLKIKANQYGTDGSGLPAYQREFIERFAPYAMLASAQSGIPARFLLAEASIETNWGQSKGAREDNNLFGIKATPGQIAAGVPVSYRDTGENAANGAAYTEKAAPFIKYPSAEAGFNGFVEKLNRTKWADQKALLKHTAENPYAQDNDVERALAGAFARTSYLTADKIDQTMLDRMARMPADLNAAGFKTAPDFNKATTDLARLAPFDPAQAQNVSEALGGFTDNDYVSPNGIPVTARPRELSGLDQFSDAITAGVEGAGRAVENTFSGFGNAIRGVFGTGAEASTPAAPAPGPYDFANGSTAGGNTPNGSFGAGITPEAPAGPAPGPYDFANGVAAGGNVPNGSFGDGITQPASTPTATILPTEAPTIGAGPQAPSVPFNGFDAKAYLAANPDVANSATYANAPLQHYLDYGYAEGRTLDPEGHQIAKGIDLNQYLQSNPDVAAARIDPLAHYLVNGAAEGRTLGPGATVSTIGAQSAASGVAAPGLSPLVGPTAGESVTASPGIGPYDFSSAYLAANPDVARAGMNAFEHYARYGAREGRAIDAAGDRFDPNAYLSQNVDVRDAGQDALTHYLTYGASEGRGATLIGPDGTARTVSSLGVTPTISAMLAPYLQPQGTAPTIGAPQGQTIGAPGLSPTLVAQSAPTIGPSASENVGGFDAAAYLRANPDVAASSRYASNPLEHYETYGFNEGRQIDASGLRLNQTFNGDSYLSANPDVARAGMNPLDHYLRFGMQEGRQIGAPSATPWVMPDTAPTIGPQTAPTIGPNFAPTIAAPAAVPSWSPSTVSPYQFGQNVSQGVQPGSFGAGITAIPQINPYGFSSGNFGAGIGAMPQTLGGSYGVGSAVSNMGMDLPSGSGIGDYSFGGNTDVSGYDANQGGGGSAPAPQEAPASFGFGDGSMAAAGFDEKGSEQAYLRGQEQAIRDANESARLFGQQITSVAPGNQTNYALGAVNTPVPSIQPFSQAPVNMSGVFAPLATAAFMPRFTF